MRPESTAAGSMSCPSPALALAQAESVGSSASGAIFDLAIIAKTHRKSAARRVVQGRAPLTLSSPDSRRRRALPAAKRRTSQNSTVALSLCVERCPLHPPGPCARLASASASASNILRICSKVRQTASDQSERPVRSTSELENNARTSTTRTGFVGPVGLMVPRAVAWPASVAVGSGSLVPRRVPREVEMKKGRLRKRGNPEAARRALAAATSGESSAAQLPRSGLPLGAARARELP